MADIVGNKARGGTPVATFQMMVDFGSIVGSLLVGLIAAARVVRLGVRRQRRGLVVAAVGWVFAPETRGLPPAGRHRRAPLGPEAGGEVP